MMFTALYKGGLSKERCISVKKYTKQKKEEKG